MRITEFGKIVRKGRLDGEVSLLQMANELGVSSAFLSGMETGRKKITPEWVSKINDFFAARNIEMRKLAEAAQVSNNAVSVEGLSPVQQMLVAGFARRALPADTLENLTKILLAADTKERKKG